MQLEVADNQHSRNRRPRAACMFGRQPDLQRVGSSEATQRGEAVGREDGTRRAEPGGLGRSGARIVRETLKQGMSAKRDSGRVVVPPDWAEFSKWKIGSYLF